MLQDKVLLSRDEIALVLRGPEDGDWRTAARDRIAEPAEQQRKLAIAETFPSLRDYTDRVLAAAGKP